jgi:hypothetical protein
MQRCTKPRQAYYTLGEKSKLIQYLNERVADQDQIATIIKILADIVKE